MRIERYEALPKWARSTINLLFGEQQSEVVDAIGEVRLLGYGSLIMPNGIGYTPLFLVDDAEVEPCLGETGVTLQRFIVGENGLRPSPLRVENVTQIIGNRGVRAVDG